MFLSLHNHFQNSQARTAGCHLYVLCPSPILRFQKEDLQYNESPHLTTDVSIKEGRGFVGSYILQLQVSQFSVLTLASGVRGRSAWSHSQGALLRVRWVLGPLHQELLNAEK